MKPYLDVPRRALSKDTRGVASGRNTQKLPGSAGCPLVPRVHEQLIPTRVWGKNRLAHQHGLSLANMATVKISSRL